MTTRDTPEAGRLWLVSTTQDLTDWDEFDAFVVRAHSAEHARALCQRREPHRVPRRFWATHDAVTVTELKADGRPGIILGSFNRG